MARPERYELIETMIATLLILEDNVGPAHLLMDQHAERGEQLTDEEFGHALGLLDVALREIQEALATLRHERAKGTYVEALHPAPVRKAVA